MFNKIPFEFLIPQILLLCNLCLCRTLHICRSQFWINWRRSNIDFPSATIQLLHNLPRILLPHVGTTRWETGGFSPLSAISQKTNMAEGKWPGRQMASRSGPHWRCESISSQIYSNPGLQQQRRRVYWWYSNQRRAM